jgi:hypothetical protein
MNRIVILLLVCFGITSLSAQTTYNSSGKAGGYRHKDHKGYDPARLVLGGGVNLGYSGDYANVGISPKVGYKIADILTVGVGLGYQYYKSPQFAVGGKFYYENDHIIFPGFWAKCNVISNLFAAVDFEYDFIYMRGYEPYYNNTAVEFKKATYFVGAPCVLVGGGIRQPVGGRTSITMEIMYDVLQADYSPYRNQLVYRGGIYVGL